jgi:hypothetical protein
MSDPKPDTTPVSESTPKASTKPVVPALAKVTDPASQTKPASNKQATQKAVDSDEEKEIKAEKEKKPNHIWTNNQKEALLTFIIDQILLGKGTDNGNLKAEGWTCVVKKMIEQFSIKFKREQLKNQKGAIRKIYIDMSFLLKQSGFGWDPNTGMVTADEDIWDNLIKASRFTLYFNTCGFAYHCFFRLIQSARLQRFALIPFDGTILRIRSSPVPTPLAKTLSFPVQFPLKMKVILRKKLAPAHLAFPAMQSNENSPPISR